MRSSSGFNRTSSSPQRYYGSTQVPISQQSYVSKLPPSVSSGISYSRPQVSYPGIIGGTQYLHPQAGLATMSSARPAGSTVLTVPAPVSYNNFVDPRPVSYQTSSYSPPRVIQAPSIATATGANLLPPQSQVLYRQTNATDGGFYHPNQFEQSSIQKTLNTTQVVRKFNNTNAQANNELLNEVQLDRIRIYKKQNVERVFGRDVTIDCNYEPHKLFSTKELRGFLVSGFQEFEANLQKLESRFSGLESSFYHLLHKGDTPKDIFDRFLVSLDKRVEKFFESFDETVIQGRGQATDYFDTSVMRNDYEFWNFKSVVKQGVIEVSNKLNDLFVARENSTYYDAQIIRSIETIIKLYQFLKSDLNTILNKSLLKSGKILEACTYNYENGEGLKTINFADFIQLDIASLISQYSEEFERTYPVLLNKKQIVTEKFHDILKDKSTQNQFDLKQLVRSVFQRERRKLYRTIYNSIVKNGKNDLDLDEDMLAENKSITDKMNKIKNRYLTIKNDPLYMEVLSGRMNLEYLKNSPTLFEENSQSVLYLEKFMVNTQQFFEDIKDALSDIVYYKQKEQDRNKEILSNVLSRAVYDLNQQERIIQDKGDMSELILYQFQVLEKSLNSDHSRQNVDTTLESTLMKQLKNNQTNYHLHNVAADLARQEKQKDEQRKALQENQIKKSKEYSSQIANLMTKPMIDKDRNQHPVKDKYNQYDDDDKYDQNSSQLKGLADKLLQTIKQRREEDLDKERRLKEEQEEVRYMKEQQYKEERERMHQEKQRMLDNTTKKFRERREQEQSEFQQRIQQKQLDEQDRKEKELERQREDEYKKQRMEEDRKRQRDEQDQLRRAKDEEDRQRKIQDEERKRQKDEDLKRQKEDDERRRQQEREDLQRKQKEDDDRRRKEDDDRKKQRELDDQKRKQKEEEDRKKQQQADEDRRKRNEEDEKKRQEDQKKRDEQRRIQQEEDDRKRKQQQDEEKKRQEELKKQRDEEDRIKKQKQDEEDRKRKQDEEDRKRKKEDDDRKREEERKKQDEERKRQDDEKKRQRDEEDRKRKQEEDDRKKKQQQEEEDRKKRLKEEEDRKRQEDEDRKKKDEEDRKKKEEERRKKDEEDRKKKEEEDRKKKQKEEEEERKRKQEEEEKRLKKQREEEEAAAQKLKEEQNKKNQKSSGFNYDDLGDSQGSGSQYKDDFDIDDYDDIVGKDNSKNKKTNEPAKTNKGFDQDELYEDIAEDSDNFNDLVGFKKPATTTTAPANNAKKAEPANVKNNKYDDFEDLDDNFDDFDDDDLNDKKKVEPPKSGLPALNNNTKTGDVSKRSNVQNSYEDDFEDFDDFSDNKKNKNQPSPPKPQEQKKSDKKSDFDDFDDIEEDIDDLMGDTSNNKNDKSGNQAKPATTATTASTKLAPLPTAQDKNKKQSNFDYDMDFDDDEDNNDDLDKDFKQEVQKQPQKNDAAKKGKDNDFDYDFPEDEEGDLNEGDLQQGQMTQEQMQQYLQAEQQQEQENMELTYELIQKTNEYIKKTRFGRSNRPNLSNYNSYDYLIRLYEEYIQNYQVFLFDYPESMKLLDLYEAYINQQDDIEQLADELCAEIQKIYYEQTQLTDFVPQTKLYFPLEANSIGFQLIEVNLMNQTISYFYMIDENEETLVQQLNEFHKFFTFTLRFDEFQASPSKVEDSTLKVLQVYEQEPYLQYMCMLFPLIYEFMSDMSDINIDQNTIERIFYIQLSLEHFYTELESNQEGVTEKFNTMLQQYSTHKEFSISLNEYQELSEEAFEQILQDMNQFKEEVLQSEDKKYGLAMFSINTGGQIPFSYYFYVAKSADDKIPHEIGLFCLQMSDQINNTLLASFQQLEEENVAFRPHVDVSRHNGLYEYSEFTVATWAHLIDKKGLSPFVALNIINFSMTPYYITYKGLD